MADLSVDEHGALTPREPAEWLVCFVPPIAPQPWHWLLKSSWKHCFALKRETDGSWTVFEPWWSRMFLSGLTPEEAQLFLRWASRGMVLAAREAIPGKSSQLRFWMTCAALVAHLLGRRYWAWTPRQLYHRLAHEPGVRHIDVRAFLEMDEARELMQ